MNIKTGLKGLLDHIENKIIYLLFIAVFLPFYITGILILGVCVYICLSKKIYDVFEKKGTILLSIFFIYAFVVAIFNLNYIGALCSVLFSAIIIISIFARKYFTIHSFEKALDISCFCGIITSLLCAVEFVYYAINPISSDKFRSTLYFFNPNYLATVLATVIIICGYKILKGKGNSVLYYVTAIFCAVGAYLTGSMFVWVEIFIGGAALLLIMRRSQILSALLLLAGTACIVIYFMPDVLPRLQDSNVTTDNRITIWGTTFEAIKTSPIFGRGFLTYFHIQNLYEGSYYTTHAHSIFLEPILSFGIVGTILIIACLILYYKRVFTCRNAQNKYHMSSLLIALTCAMFVHGLTDLTFLWVQTGLFYGLVFGGVGIEEKMLKIA